MVDKNFNQGEWIELELGQDFKVNIWIECNSEISIKEKREIALNKIKNNLVRS